MTGTWNHWARVALVLAGCIVGAGSHAQDAKALYQRSLAGTCANCHGSDGRPPQGSAIATLAGMPAAHFTDRMKAFKAGGPNITVMDQIAKGFNDAQIEQMAAYFAAQPRP